MQDNKTILIEFFEPETYKYHYTSLYSFTLDYKYEEFEKILYQNNVDISQEIIKSKCFDFLKLKSHQNRFHGSPWVIPWIEFVNEEFISTLMILNKDTINKADNTLSHKYVFTKTCYLFVSNLNLKQNFNNIFKNKDPKQLTNIQYFYKNEKFDHPITFCFMFKNNELLALRLEIHRFDLKYTSMETYSLEDSFKDKNFVYFYNSLKEIEYNFGQTPEKLNDVNGIKDTVIQGLQKHAIFCI